MRRSAEHLHKQKKFSQAASTKKQGDELERKESRGGYFFYLLHLHSPHISMQVMARAENTVFLRVEVISRNLQTHCIDFVRKSAKAAGTETTRERVLASSSRCRHRSHSLRSRFEDGSPCSSGMLCSQALGCDQISPVQASRGPRRKHRSPSHPIAPD